MEVPLARGLLTRTTIWTEPEAAAARLPTDQVTTPEAKTPPAVAETKVVLAGTVSVRTTLVVFKYPASAEIYALSLHDALAIGSGESVREALGVGEDTVVVETAVPATGAVSLESML